MIVSERQPADGPPIEPESMSSSNGRSASTARGDIHDPDEAARPALRMGTERDRLGSELARVDILKRDLDLGSRVGRRQELEQGFEAGDEVVVDRHDDLADLQQPVDRTLLDHTVEPDPALDDGLDAEIFERGDNRRLFRHRHQLEIALTLLCRSAGTEDLFAGA